MAWTAEDRRKYAPAIREALRQGMLVRLAATIDTIDPPCKTGRPRDWSTVTMLGALWHLARDGCVWGRLPVGPCLPPHRSVWSRFLRWRLRSVLDRALAVLVACRRLAGGRKRRPTAAVIDTKSVKTGPQRGPRGYDAHKKVKGRKRVLMVDVEGDPLGVRVVPADVQDRDALAALAPDLAAHPSLRLAWTDLCRTATRSPPSRRTSPPTPRCAWPGRTSASPRSAAASSSPATASSGSSSARSAAEASSSSRGAGRSSRRSVACNATAACASTTR